jgi:hypothetical protein
MALWPTIPSPRPRPAAAQARLLRQILAPDWLYDHIAGDFVVQPDGDVQRADGFRAWIQGWIDWLLTQQAAYPIFWRSYGLDHERLMQLSTRARIEAAYTARIKARAAREPATKEVASFTFRWVGDTCFMAFQIINVTGDTVPMGVDLRV